MTSAMGVSYDISTDWIITESIYGDEETQYQFGLHLDTSEIGGIDAGYRIEMAWGTASDDPESVYQQFNFFTPTLYQ